MLGILDKKLYLHDYSSNTREESRNNWNVIQSSCPRVLALQIQRYFFVHTYHITFTFLQHQLASEKLQKWQNNPAFEHSFKHGILPNNVSWKAFFLAFFLYLSPVNGHLA